MSGDVAAGSRGWDCSAAWDFAGAWAARRVPSGSKRVDKLHQPVETLQGDMPATLPPPLLKPKFLLKTQNDAQGLHAK